MKIYSLKVVIEYENRDDIRRTLEIDSVVLDAPICLVQGDSVGIHGEFELRGKQLINTGRNKMITGQQAVLGRQLAFYKGFNERTLKLFTETARGRVFAWLFGGFTELRKRLDGWPGYGGDENA